jgi:hypothetical protein
LDHLATYWNNGTPNPLNIDDIVCYRVNHWLVALLTSLLSYYGLVFLPIVSTVGWLFFPPFQPWAGYFADPLNHGLVVLPILSTMTGSPSHLSTMDQLSFPSSQLRAGYFTILLTIDWLLFPFSQSWVGFPSHSLNYGLLTHPTLSSRGSFSFSHSKSLAVLQIHGKKSIKIPMWITTAQDRKAPHCLDRVSVWLCCSVLDLCSSIFWKRIVFVEGNMSWWLCVSNERTHLFQWFISFSQNMYKFRFANILIWIEAGSRGVTSWVGLFVQST